MAILCTILGHGGTVNTARGVRLVRSHVPRSPTRKRIILDECGERAVTTVACCMMCCYPGHIVNQADVSMPASDAANGEQARAGRASGAGAGRDSWM